MRRNLDKAILVLVLLLGVINVGLTITCTRVSVRLQTMMDMMDKQKECISMLKEMLTVK